MPSAKKPLRHYKNQLTNQEIEEIFQARGRELAVLLYLSNFPQEIKEAWIEVLPLLSLKQIDQLLSVLEKGFLEALYLAREEDKAIKKARSLLVKFVKEQNKLNKEFLKKFSKFKKNLEVLTEDKK